MVLPVAFYELDGAPVARHDAEVDAPVAFGALDRPDADAIPVAWTGPACDPARVLSTSGDGEVALWGRPPGTPGLVDLVPWTLPDGTVIAAVDDRSADGGVPGAPLVAVWPARWEGPVPLSEFPLPERADAGPDQCDVPSPVTLSGAASVLAEGIETATWRWEGGEASGLDVAVDLPPGLHVLELEVEGPSGSALDTVAVRVIEEEPGTATGTTTVTPAEVPEAGPRGESAAGGCGCSTRSATRGAVLRWLGRR